MRIEGLDSLTSRIREIEEFAERDAIGIAHITAMNAIKSLTSGGQDIHAKPMKDYTIEYKKRKTKLVGSASPVNLRLKGNLMKSLELQGNESGVFDSNEPKAVGNLKHRKWFGVSRVVLNEVEKAIAKHLIRLWT